MRTQLSKLVLTVAFGLALAFTLSCSSDKDDDNHSLTKYATYYYETGGITTVAYDLINSTPGITAEVAKMYCNQHPVLNDPYKDAKSNVPRSEIESDLDEVFDVPGFSKAQFLKLLDSSGAAFQMFLLLDGGYAYYYVEKEL